MCVCVCISTKPPLGSTMHYIDGLVLSTMSMHPNGYIIRETFYWIGLTLKSHNETPWDVDMDIVFYKIIFRKVLKPGAYFPFHSGIFFGKCVNVYAGKFRQTREVFITLRSLRKTNSLTLAKPITHSKYLIYLKQKLIHRTYRPQGNVALTPICNHANFPIRGCMYIVYGHQVANSLQSFES